MSLVPKPQKQPEYKTGILLIDDFSMMCVSTIINPFRSANRELGYKAFTWDFLTVNDQPVLASDGFEAKPSCLIGSAQKFDYFFVSAGLQTDPPERAKLNAALQRFSRQSDIFGGVCTGAFILARAGFLNGKNFTVHWENQATFIEEFPDLIPKPSLYVMDGNIWTASGGLACLDMTLNIISDKVGMRIANTVANVLHVDRIRKPTIEQRSFFLAEYETLPPKIHAAIKLMIENIEYPLSISELSNSVGITVRSLERGFKQQLGSSPARHYRKMRLERAKQLLWHSNMSILQVSILTGFPSPSYLSRLYREEFGVLPSAERKKSRV